MMERIYDFFCIISVHYVDWLFCLLLYFLIVRAAQGDEADFRLAGYIAHSLKIVQLLEWSGQGFYRDPGKKCIAISSPVRVSAPRGL